MSLRAPKTPNRHAGASPQKTFGGKANRFHPNTKHLVLSFFLAAVISAFSAVTVSGSGRLNRGGGEWSASGMGMSLGMGVRMDEDRSEKKEGPPYLTAAPLIVFTNGRAKYLDRTLSALLRYHPVNLRSEGKYHGRIVASPVVITQDGDDGAMDSVIAKFREKFWEIGVPVYDMHHERANSGGSYRDLAVHYGWGLRRLFSGDAYDGANGGEISRAARPPLPQRAIIMEEDVLVAPDFFPYFASLVPLLDSDESVMAVSAFNDNGKEGTVGNARRLVRSDFFPGLGWMMTRRLWDEIGPIWPGVYWDDWLRQADVRKGRHFIRPEISRTFHIGVKGGASGNHNGHHLSAMRLNDVQVRWEDEDLSYLDAEAFRSSYYRRAMEAASATNAQTALSEARDRDVRVEWRDFQEYQRLAAMFRLYDDERGGVARSAFENIVDFRPPLAREGGAVGSGGGSGGRGVEESAARTGKHLVFLSPPLDVLRKNLEDGRVMGRKEFAKSLRLNPAKNNDENLLNFERR